MAGGSKRATGAANSARSEPLYEWLGDIRRGTVRVEAIFLVLGLLFGTLFLLATPPFQVPDEPVHFVRAYQVSQGGILSQRQGNEIGGTMPASLVNANKVFWYLSYHPDQRTTVNQVLDELRMPLNSSETTFAQFPTSALYSPVEYLPQAVGIGLGRIFNLGPFYLMYMGRLASLLVWLALGFMAIRIIPTGKWALLTIFCVPMLMFMAPTLSADSFVFGLTALAVALSVRFASSEDEMQRSDLVLLLILTGLIALLKPPFSLAFLVFLFIPVSKYKDRATYGIFWAAALALAFVLMGGWSVAIQRLYVPARVDVLVSPQQQMAVVMQNPLAFLGALYQTYWANSSALVSGPTDGIFSSWTGTLGWLDTPLPVWLSFLTIANVTVGMLSTGGICSQAKTVYKWVAGLLPVAVFVLINLALYLSGSEVGATQIAGIQGRYFLPVAILLIPWLTTRKSFRLRVEGLRSTVYMTLLQFVILGYAYSFLLQRYWV